MRYFLILTLLLMFSCDNSQEEKSFDIENIETDKESKLIQKEINTPKKVEQSIIDNVEFDFKLTKGPKNIIPDYEFKGSLKNNNNDTVYFLSQTCHSEYASLEYDESMFSIWTGITCYVSNSIIYRIAPNEAHSFEAKIWNKQNAKTIKIGFDFYAVTKDFRLNTDDNINIFDRPQEDKTIIWAKEKSL